MSQLMNPDHAKLHENGDIHIHDMDFMNMGTLTCCQIDLSKLFNGGFSTGAWIFKRAAGYYELWGIGSPLRFKVTKMISMVVKVSLHLISI